MEPKTKKTLAFTIAIIVPFVLLLTVPKLLDVLKLHRSYNEGILVPWKLYPVGTKDTVNRAGEKVVDTVYHVVPNFKFQTQSGDSLELDSLRGKLYVANFFFSTCPGICPKLSNSMERVQQAFIKDDVLRLVSISVDPERDTLQPLRKYADAHDAIPGKWYFLRGSHQQISDLAGKGLYITAKPDEDNGPEAFVHSEKLVVVDWDGNIRGYYSGIDSSSVNRMMADLVLIIRSMEKGFSFRKQKETSRKIF